MHSSDTLRELDELIQSRSILRHPFYVAWREGQLNRQQVATYARVYWPHVEAFPAYLESVIAERQMRRFKSAAHLQWFAAVHGVVHNLFRVGRHLLRSTHHRLLRRRAFVEWEAVTSAC